MKQFLQALFSDGMGREGRYIAVGAYDRERQRFAEQRFFRSRGKVRQWADVMSEDHDIFVCPSLRMGKQRRKGEAVRPLHWLWCDVDMQKVSDVDEVRRRIRDLGTIIVRSGSGINRHVYVRLNHPVGMDLHYRLNRALNVYLSGDGKYTDNCYLRLPGTINHKNGARVRVSRYNDWRDIGVSELRQLPGWDDHTTQAAVMGGPWEGVAIESLADGRLRRTAQRILRMDVDQAIGRYGSRHGAIYAVVGELVKAGATRDLIHTVMDDYKPALDKEADEDGYNLHRDVDNCIGRHMR